MNSKIENAMEVICLQSGVAEADVWDMLKSGDTESSIRVCHQLALNAGWWNDLQTGERKERDMGEVFTLIHSEITEAFEGWRKDLMDDKLPHRKMVEVELADTLIRIFDACGGFEWGTPNPVVVGNLNCRRASTGELFAWAQMSVSDAYRATLIDTAESRINALSLCMAKLRALADRFELDVQGAIIEKLAFNISRKDHTREARLAEGGKKC